MNTIILEAQALTKAYKQTLALDHIDLKIEKGKIYGFIGQNGAGKTTFLRLVTGLAFPSNGTLSLWGKSTPSQLQEQRKRIGCMIETPALFPSLTAYQNMEVQRIQRGIPDQAIIEKCLHMVSLPDTGKKLAGIVEIRKLLKSLNKEYGITILISSHILEELYQTASDFILIDKGKIIEEISDRELNERCKRHIAIKVKNSERALLVFAISSSPRQKAVGFRAYTRYRVIRVPSPGPSRPCPRTRTRARRARGLCRMVLSDCMTIWMI